MFFKIKNTKGLLKDEKKYKVQLNPLKDTLQTF
jgi:hypothetical protein